MKKILLLAFIVISLKSKSQVKVDGVDINTLGINYCEIVGSDMGLFKKKIIIAVDYGQKINLADGTAIEDMATNKPVIFNSMIDALNFMDKNGWEYINCYAVSIPNSVSIYHYLLKRKK
jgi:hypothetical protein